MPAWLHTQINALATQNPTPAAIATAYANDMASAISQTARCLRPGGRVAILTFHSGEDRRVKHLFRDALRGGIFSETNDEVIRPSAEEIRANPRAAPAKLRWARK